MKRLSQDAVRGVVERLMVEQRGHRIEYNGFLSNHVAWVVVPHLRLGKCEEEVKDLVATYNNRIKAEPVVEAPHEVTDAELDGLVSYKGENFATLLAFFDEQIKASIEVNGRDDGLAEVCKRHLGRVQLGLGAAAFHPILELGLGIECSSPCIVANGLAYMHSRSWVEFDLVHPVTTHSTEAGNPLIATLKTWAATDLSTCLPEAFEKASQLKMGIGAFQHRHLTMLTTIPVFKDHPVRVPPQDGLITAIEELLLFAAVTLPLSGSDFFILHGFTSLWSLYHIIKTVPLEYDVQAEMVASWVRAYFACYLAQDTPCKWYLPFLFNNVEGGLPKVLVALEKFQKVEEGSWESAVAKANPRKDEHVLKAVWMMMELAEGRKGATQIERDILKYTANIVAENEVPIPAVRCATNPPVRIKPSEARYLAEQYGSVWGHGGTSTDFDGLFTPDVVLTEQPYAPEGVKSTVRSVEQHWTDFIKGRMINNVQLESVLLDDDSNKAAVKWTVNMKSKIEGTEDWKDVKLTQVAILKYSYDDMNGWRVCESEEYWQNMPPDVVQYMKRKPTEAEMKAVMEMRKKRQEMLEKISLSEYSMR